MRSNVKRRTAIAALTGALATSGCLGSEAQAQGRSGGPPAMPPMPVDVDTARVQTVVDAVRATGRIEAVNAVELRPDDQGRITAILFREGQSVARGTPCCAPRRLAPRPSAIWLDNSSSACVACANRMRLRPPIWNGRRPRRGAQTPHSPCFRCRSSIRRSGRRSPAWSGSAL
jgi:hypothetical protein